MKGNNDNILEMNFGRIDIEVNDSRKTRCGGLTPPFGERQWKDWYIVADGRHF